MRRRFVHEVEVDDVLDSHGQHLQHHAGEVTPVERRAVWSLSSLSMTDNLETSLLHSSEVHLSLQRMQVWARRKDMFCTSRL